MLRTLAAKDFAIIENAELALREGLTALTGETGAGKSLMVDALLLLCGARADGGMVRQDCEKAELHAEFDISGADAVRQWLQTLELDEGQECRIRRIIRADGSSRAFINDRPVTVGTLKGLAEQLIEIHGQHEHQSLLKKSSQLAILDAQGISPAVLAEVARLAGEWQATEREIAVLEQTARREDNQLDYLRFQIQELGEHALAPEEFAELEQRHHRLNHANELVAGVEQCVDLLSGESQHAIVALLHRAHGVLEKSSQHDPALKKILQSLLTAKLEVDDAVGELESYLQKQELEPADFAALDRQLAKLLELSRKYRVPAAELKVYEVQLKSQFDTLAHIDDKLAELKQARERICGQYAQAAQELSRQRQKQATKMNAEISALMQELGMQGGRFEVQVGTDPDAPPNRGGADDVEFLVAANAGQTPRPLRKVASGGELARIGLAIEVAAMAHKTAAAMVFDEVDTGIGGAIAEVVGRKLKQLGAARQVICVTHLPQVAAQADHHVAVRKNARDGRTATELMELGAAERAQEIARMLGGIEITAQTMSHAKDMLRRARVT